MFDIPDAPWIGNDDYGRDDRPSQYDIEYDRQDDDRDNEICNALLDELSDKEEI